MAYLNGKPIFFSPHVHIKEPDVIVKSWADVQAVVRAGKAKKAFSIGDQFQCGHGDYGILTWDVIGIDHDTPSDQNFTHSITLQLHYCFPSYQLQMHTNNYDTWKDSFARYWLNVPTDEYAKPSTGSGSLYNTPFEYNFDDAFLEVVGAVDKKTRSRDGSTLDITSDKFFLLCCEEVFSTGNKNYGSGEGKPYQYYISMSQHALPTRAGDTGRIKYKGSFINNQLIISADPAHGWGLRSPNSSVYDYAVFKDGTVDATSAMAGGNFATFIAPACCIY